MKIAIKTLGCRSNRAESDALFRELKKKHVVFELNEGASTFTNKFNAECDVYVVNTCTVTSMADRKSRQAVRSLKKQTRSAK